MLINIVFTLMLIFAYLVETTFAGALQMGNIVPNLVIIVVCMYALLKGRRAGLIFGFFAGLLIDLFNGYENVVGINALIYMYIGLVNGIFKDIIYINNFHIPLISVGVSDLAVSFVNYIITFITISNISLINFCFLSAFII